MRFDEIERLNDLESIRLFQYLHVIDKIIRLSTNNLLVLKIINNIRDEELMPRLNLCIHIEKQV